MSEADGSERKRSGARRRTAPSPPEPEPRPVCTVAFCPICMAVTAAQGAAPDAVDHLLAAAREFFLAARAVLDARGDQLAGERERSAGGFERIEIS